MRSQVQEAAGQLTATITSWPGVDVVLLGEAAEIDTLDPYFNIDLYVFHRQPVPEPADRVAQFTGVAAYEPSEVENSDRFLRGDLPVSVVYYDVYAIEAMLGRVEAQLWALRRTGTKMLHRLQHGHVMHESGSWLADTRARLAAVGPAFWQRLMTAARAELEVSLRYMGAAVHREDDLIFLSATADFVQHLISFVFAYNSEFQPSGRMLYERMRGLPQLPDGFVGRLDSLLRNDAAFTPGRKREVAELLARSIFRMS